MKQKFTLISICTFILVSCLSTVSYSSGALYKLSKQHTFKSSPSHWDYIKMQPNSSRLFMARVGNGLTVFDVDKGEIIKNVENSIGANGPLILPQYNRAYIAMVDASLLQVELDSLKSLARVKLADTGGLNSAIYDGFSKRVITITGRRKTDSIWFVIDPESGNLIKEIKFPFRKMDDPATDEQGTLYAPVRFDNLILKIDSKTYEELDRWNMPCNVSKVQFQPQTKRLFAACVGKNPLFLVIDVQTGAILKRIPIGEGMDALVIDEKRKRIITSNGIEGSLTVIQQHSPDNYDLLGTVYTRAGARMMHIDDRNGNLYVVFAEFTYGAPNETTGDVKRTYHPDTFTLLTYEPE